MAHSIYAEELTAALHHGHPLWDPDCYPEVTIADVGYIRHGQFCRLFNASLPVGHQENQVYGEPDGYEPLEIGAIQERTPLPPGAMVSNTVCRRGANIGFTGSIIPVGASFGFDTSRDRGAILIINSEAYRKDALRSSAFKSYLVKHYKSWLRLANNERNARDLSESDLVFVTGRDNTADWAAAAFTKRSLSGGVNFQAGYPTVGNAQFSVWGSWEQSSGMHSHCGPRIPRMNRAITDDESTEYTSTRICAADLNRYNQCIFLRGFHVMEKTAYARRKVLMRASNSSDGLEAVTKPWFTRSPSGSSLSDTSSTNISRSSSDGDRLSRKHSLLASPISMDEELNTMSNRARDRAPIEALLEYILENCETASIAVAHDEDLATILQETQDDDEAIDFSKLIAASDSQIYVDSQGVAALRDYDAPAASDLQSHTESKTSPPMSPALGSPSFSEQSTPTLTPMLTPRMRELDLLSEKQLLKFASPGPSLVPTQNKGQINEPLAPKRKPPKAPHSETYHMEQERIRTEIDALQARLAVVREKISLTTRTGRGVDRRNALRAELDMLRDQQLQQRTERDKISADLKIVQEDTQKKVKEFQTLTKKLPARTIEDVDAQIAALERSIETGTKNLSQEKTALRLISSLRRARTAVETSQSLQADIDAHRTRADALRKKLGPESRAATTTRMDAVREELEMLRRESEKALAERNSLYDERTHLQMRLSALHDERRRAVENYRTEREEHRRRADEERVQAAAKARAERIVQEDQRRIQAQERLLEKARAPAFAAEIRDCRSLIEYFSSVGKGDQSTPSTSTSTSTPSSTATTQYQLRQPVENHPEAWAGWVPLKRLEEDSYFVGGKGKAKKRHRKGATSTASDTAKISVPLGILSTLLSLSITPPAVAAQVPQTIEELRNKMEWYEANQSRVTEENVEQTIADLHRINGRIRNNLVLT